MFVPSFKRVTWRDLCTLHIHPEACQYCKAKCKHISSDLLFSLYHLTAINGFCVLFYRNHAWQLTELIEPYHNLVLLTRLQFTENTKVFKHSKANAIYFYIKFKYKFNSQVV